MLRIRFLRQGKRNQPFFAIVVVDKNRPPHSGKFIEKVGFYNPLTKERKIKKERVSYWLEKGAKPSDTVFNLLVEEKVIEGRKIPVHKKPKEEEKETEKKEKEVKEGEEGKKEKTEEKTEGKTSEEKEEKTSEEEKEKKEEVKEEE